METRDLEKAAEGASSEQSRPPACALTGKKRGYLRVKRVQDVLLSAMALVLLSPLMLLIALAVVLDDRGGGPIFSQIRCGQNGRAFRLYKFRTMCVDAEIGRAHV